MRRLLQSRSPSSESFMLYGIRHSAREKRESERERERGGVERVERVETKR